MFCGSFCRNQNILKIKKDAIYQNFASFYGKVFLRIRLGYVIKQMNFVLWRIKYMKKITLLVSLLLVFAFISVKAQTEISPEKQKAIKELSTIMSANNTAEDLAKAMSAQFNSMHAEIVKSIVERRTDLTQEERNSLEKNLIDEALTSANRFQNKLFEKLDYNALMDEIIFNVYDKYYSLEEINDLIVFYKTPTGQKSLKVMQPLIIETMQLTQAKLVPKLLTVMQELREEHSQQITKKVDEMKPRKKKSK